MENVKICKLVDGSFVIGKISKDGELLKAVEVMIGPGRTGGMVINLVPLMYPINMQIDHDLVIGKSKILIEKDADDEMISNYIEVTTGIITPKSIITK